LHPPIQDCHQGLSGVGKIQYMEHNAVLFDFTEQEE
jgi:hypothetical protein